MLTGTVGFFENKQSAFDMEIVGIERNSELCSAADVFQTALYQVMKNKM